MFPIEKLNNLVWKGKKYWERYLYERSERRRKRNDEKALIEALKAIARRSRECEMKCPKCEGRGTWLEHEYDAAYMRDLRCFFRCKYCDGKGKIKRANGHGR